MSQERVLNYLLRRNLRSGVRLLGLRFHRKIHLIQNFICRFAQGLKINHFSILFSLVLAFLLAFTHLTIAAPTSPFPIAHQAEQALREERYKSAATFLEQLLLEPNPDRRYTAQILSNLGIAYRNLGQYSQSADRHRLAGKQMVQLIQESKTDRDRQHYRRDLGQILLNLANTQEALGNYDRALRAYTQSLHLARETQDIQLESIIRNNLGGLYSTLGEDDRALTELKIALKLNETKPSEGQPIDKPSSSNPRLAVANTHLNLASIYHIRNQYNNAKTEYQIALTIAESLKYQALQAKTLSNLGLLYEDLKDYPKAIATHQKSIQIARTLADPEIQAQALNNLGHTLHVADRLSDAETALRQSIQLLDRLRLNLSDTYKVSKLDTQLHTYSLLQQVLISAKKPEAALEAAEQGRARAFAELLSQRYQASKSSSRLTQTNLLNNTATITLDQIRNTAKKQNATLIEYAIVPDDDFKFRGKQRAKAAKLLIWVVQPNGKITLRSIDLITKRKTQGELTETITIARCLSPDCPSLEELLQLQPIALPDSVAESLTYPALPELYNTLIEPIQDLLPKNPTDRIIIIPQESLFLVPFAALPDRQGRYFIEQHTIAYAPSIQVLGLLPVPKASPSPKPLIIGNPAPMPESLAPLPNAELEAIAIAKGFKIAPIIGPQATRASLYPQLERATHIHLATHGLLEYGQVEAIDTPGAIALAPSQGDNGLLTANDIFNLSLKAELVVLSACDTGRGTLTGDGVLGLSRSWLVAGTPSVVVSLWAVNDRSTAAFMVAFYQALKTNPDRAIALRQAMLTTLKQFPSPKDWAAFTLVGR